MHLNQGYFLSKQWGEAQGSKTWMKFVLIIKQIALFSLHPNTYLIK